MHPDDAQKLQPLAIDVDQWRRDIQTFVESTQRELQSIRDELSGNFAARPEQPALATAATFRDRGRGDRPADQPEPQPRVLTPSAHSGGPAAEDRLARLKRRLAAQVAPLTPPGGSAATTHKLVPGHEKQRG